MIDFIIRGAQVIDGTGAPRRQADVAVQGDRIVRIGDCSSVEAAETIDASGRVLAPGFVDVHTHSDGHLFDSEPLAAKVRQGVTSEALMLDGIGYAPVDERTAAEWMFYLRGLNALRMDQYQGWHSLADFAECLERRLFQNAFLHVPYANLRALAKGFGRGPLDDFQRRDVRALTRAGMEQGAVGLSTGIDYIVQCHATTEEIIDACREVARFDGLYATHIRYKEGLLKSLREAVQIARESGVRLHISHLKAPSEADAEQVMQLLDEARRDVDLRFDVYPYQPGSTMLNFLLPYDVWENGPLGAMSLLNDPDVRRRFKRGLQAYRLDLDHIRIAWVPSKANSHHQGQLLSEFVEERGVPAEQALCDLLWEERLAVLLVFDEGADPLVYPFLKHDLFVFGSDGIEADGGLVHPRMFGSTPRILGPCVRDWKLFSLEEAVAKLSSRPARWFRLAERGEIQEGYFADLVLFDPETVRDRATFEAPRQFPDGIEFVWVNGRCLVRDGESVSSPEASGKVLRRCDEMSASDAVPEPK